LLPKDDIARELFKNEMIRRKNLFLKAIDENDVSILPRINKKLRNSKCMHCVFYDKCMNEDEETEQAAKMADEIDLLDIPGLVDFKPFLK
jgi:predicted AAA+ superfamily ATPase